MNRLALLALASLLSACVWNPSDQTTQSRFQSVPMQGWAQTSGAEIAVSVFNHQTGVDDVVRIVDATDTPMFSTPQLYSWDAGWKVFEQKYWYDPAAGCSSGMLRMRATENGSRLSTFTEGQRDCVLDEMNDGSHPAGAAQTCGDGNQIVLFAPSDC